MSARDDYPMLAKLAERDRHMPWPEAASEVDRALDEIDRLRDAVTVCPYVRTSDEGTSYCSLGTA